MSRRLILWDVDGTLLRAGPSGREAFHRAVASVLGRPAVDTGSSMSGKTDPEIALDILAEMAIADDEARRQLPAVLESLERQLEATVEVVRRDGHVLPGVRELLARLHGIPGVVQTVLTGNVRANAALKVGAFGLDEFLDLEVGAYGSDAEDRRQLVPIALRKLRDLRSVAMRPDQTWIIGDTPRDLACARAGGARCLLVATGLEPFEELAALGADATLEDLTDTDAAQRILLD